MNKKNIKKIVKIVLVSVLTLFISRSNAMESEEKAKPSWQNLLHATIQDFLKEKVNPYYSTLAPDFEKALRKFTNQKDGATAELMKIILESPAVSLMSKMYLLEVVAGAYKEAETQQDQEFLSNILEKLFAYTQKKSHRWSELYQRTGFLKSVDDGIANFMNSTMKNGVVMPWVKEHGEQLLIELYARALKNKTLKEFQAGFLQKVTSTFPYLLHNAARYGDPCIRKKILEELEKKPRNCEELSIQDRFKNKQDLLYDDAITVMSYLLEQKNFDINALDNEGKTPLHHAILARNKKAVKLLLEKGADPTKKDVDNKAPLDLVVEWLEEAKDDQQSRDAAKELFTILVKHKDIPKTDKTAQINRLFTAAVKNRSTDDIAWLIGNMEQDYRSRFLYIAAEHGAPMIIDSIYKKDDFDQNTLINVAHFAARKKKKENVKKLLEITEISPHTWDARGIAICDRMPSLVDQESWATWFCNCGPEIIGCALSGAIAAATSLLVHNPSNTKAAILSLLTAGLIGTHIAERKVQKNFTTEGYLNRTLFFKLSAGILGATSAWLTTQDLNPKPKRSHRLCSCSCPN